MSARFEQSIVDWYNRSRTASLEYLNLETQKPKLSDISNNIDCVFDRISLLSRVTLKNFKQVLEKQQEIEGRIDKLEKGLVNLTTLFAENRPLTKGEVHQLVREVAAQPKKIEEEALKISADLQKKVEQVEELVKRIEKILT